MTAQLHTLSNGTTVIIDDMPGTEVAALAYYFRIGARYEQDHENGLAHFLEHMSFKGTDRFTARELSIAMDDLGAKSNAFTSREATSYFMYGGAEDVFHFNDLVSDISINLSLPQNEIELERGAILSEIDMYGDDPSSCASDNLFFTAYKGQAYGNTILGPKSNIRNFNRAAFDDFRKEHYHTGNLIVSVAGDVDPQAILKDIERKTAHMPQGKRSTAVGAKFQGGSAELIKPVNQVNLMLAFESSAINDENRFAESVMKAVLSDGMSSRLFNEIREKRGLVYGVGAQNMMSTDTGLFLLYAGTAPENVEKFMPVMADEIKKIAMDKVSDAELARAKKQMLTSSRLSKDSLMGRLNGNSNSYNMRESLPNDKALTNKINAVTKDEILAAAQRVFSGDFALSSVGAKGHPDYAKAKLSLAM